MEKAKLEISLEPLRKRSIFIAVPAYGGLININFFMSCLALQRTLTDYGISHTFFSMGNESLISRGRNRLAAEFLKSDCTDLLFIDGDIEFNPLDVLALMHFDKPVIGGAYPLKKISWKNIKNVVLAHPEIPEEDLPACGGLWSAHMLNQVDFEVYSPVPVAEIATGFMLIRRETLEALAPKLPTYPDQQSGLTITDFFPVGVVNGRYESEDYSFCRLVRESDREVWLCPWMKLNHQGTYSFTGNMHLALQYLNTTVEKEIN